MPRRSLIPCRSGVDSQIVIVVESVLDELAFPVSVYVCDDAEIISYKVSFETIKDDARIVSSNVRDKTPDVKLRLKYRRLALVESEITFTGKIGPAS